MKDFLLKNIIPDTFVDKDKKRKIKNPSAPEWIFILLVAFAVLRLIHLQVVPHKTYTGMFNLVKGDYAEIGEIQDRDGNPIARKATAIDLEINYGSTEESRQKLSALDDTKEFPRCADVKNGDNALKKKLFSGKYSYTVDCSVFKEEKLKRNRVFQDYFLEKNKKLEENCIKKKFGFKCPKITFNDYLEYQKQLEDIYEPYNIFGFKFYPKQNGILDRIYQNRKYYDKYLREVKIKTVEQLNIPQNEMLELLAGKKGQKSKYLKKNMEKEIADEYRKNEKKEIPATNLKEELNKRIKTRFNDTLAKMTVEEYCRQSELVDSPYIKVKGILKKECSYLNKINEFQNKINNIKFGNLQLKSTEKKDILEKMGYAFQSENEKKVKKYWKEIENKTLEEYFAEYKEDDNWVLKINKKELYERNVFSHYLLKKLLSDDEVKKEHKVIDKKGNPVSDKILVGKKYCKGSYSLLKGSHSKKIRPDDLAKINACKILYDHNLKVIKEFLRQNIIFTGSLGEQRINDDLEDETKDFVFLTEITAEKAYNMFPKVKYFIGYNTAGINFAKYDSFVNMLGTADIEENSAIRVSSVHMEKALAKLGTSMSEAEKNKSALAEYMMAPLLGLDYNGMNVIKAIKSEKTMPETKNWFGLTSKYHQELKENKNIILTIDSYMQFVTETELKQKCEELKADRGMAIIQDVTNGEIIAAAEYSSPYSYYTYINENKLLEECKAVKGKDCKYSNSYTDYGQWKNAGMASNLFYKTYKPGSTFKPFAMAIALQYGEDFPDKKLFSQEEIDGRKGFNLKSIRDSFLNLKDSDVQAAWKNIKESHGEPVQRATLERIIAESSNVGASFVAYKLWQAEGVTVSSQTASSDWNDYYLFKKSAEFGFGSKTVLGKTIGHREAAGNLFFDKDRPDPKKTGGRELIIKEYLKSSFGQGPMMVTPVQLASAYSALINGGTWYTPHIIRSIGGEEQKYEYRSGVISEKNSEIIRQYMNAVMYRKKDSQGTGASYRPSNIEMGGKTGTADIPFVENRPYIDKNGNQKIKRTEGKKGSAYMASFVGFIPYEKPKYVILVMIDENRNMSKFVADKNTLYGGPVAGPVVKKIAEKLAGIPKNDEGGE